MSEKGTFECPVCKLETPHFHDTNAVNKERFMRYIFEIAYEHASKFCPNLRVNAWGNRATDCDLTDPNLRGKAWNHMKGDKRYWEHFIEELWLFSKALWQKRDEITGEDTIDALREENEKLLAANVELRNWQKEDYDKLQRMREAIEPFDNFVKNWDICEKQNGAGCKHEYDRLLSVPGANIFFNDLRKLVEAGRK